MSGARRAGARTWNRRLHYYLGLYFLVFVWLFSVSGLLLNHPKWLAARLAEQRRESTTEHDVRPPSAEGDLDTARDLMRQLDITGEVGDMTRVPAAGRFEFRVARPGGNWLVVADLPAGRASVRRVRVPAFGVLNALHTFTGVAMDEPERRRDWIWTRLWSTAMDALAVGLIVLVITGLYLWYRLPRKRVGGLVALAAGTACCAWFALGFAAMLGP